MGKTIKLEGKALPILVKRILREMNYGQPSHIQINDKIKSEIVEIKSALDAFEQEIPSGDFDNLFFQIQNIYGVSKLILEELKSLRENSYYDENNN